MGGALADVVLITKQLRMEWTDAMAVDPSLSPIAFRVGCVIGSHFNKHSGDTYVKQETIAALLGVSKRTVQDAIGNLERLGYLIVVRRQLGVRMDGRRVCGGKGVANTYLPAFQRTQLAATNGASKVAANCHLWLEQRWQNPASKVAADCHPTLASSSKKNPTRASNTANGSSAETQRAAEGSKAQCLVHPGTHAFDAWLSYFEQIGASKMLKHLRECVVNGAPAAMRAELPPPTNARRA